VVRRALVLGVSVVLGLGACGGSTGTTGPLTGSCQTDLDCGGDVCTRSGECVAAVDVWAVKLTWTVGGQPASAASCAAHPDLTAELFGIYAGDQIAWEPVPCAAGVFNVDKIARRYTGAALSYGTMLSLSANVDANGLATFALP
jgi:hypothetical protein